MQPQKQMNAAAAETERKAFLKNLFYLFPRTVNPLLDQFYKMVVVRSY
jgi:hypothetical protein